MPNQPTWKTTEILPNSLNDVRWQQPQFFPAPAASSHTLQQAALLQQSTQALLQNLPLSGLTPGVPLAAQLPAGHIANLLQPGNNLLGNGLQLPQRPLSMPAPAPAAYQNAVPRVAANGLPQQMQMQQMQQMMPPPAYVPPRQPYANMQMPPPAPQPVRTLPPVGFHQGTPQQAFQNSLAAHAAVHPPPVIEIHDPIRAELLSLNKLMRNKGAPPPVFGKPTDGHAVGKYFYSRPELALTGMHRHFLSEVSYTHQGVESLVLSGSNSARADDHGERIYYRGAGTQASQVATCLKALSMNVERRRPIRVLRVDKPKNDDAQRRVDPADGRSHTKQEFLDFYKQDGMRRWEAAKPPTGGDAEEGESYRYDGLYHCYKCEFGGGPNGLAMQFVLIRQSGQPPLPAGVGEPLGSGAAGKDGMQKHFARAAAQLALSGEIERLPPPTTKALPRAAEEELLGDGGYGLGDGSGGGGSSASMLTVGEAIKKLRSIRASLLGELTPAEGYALAKRSLLHEVELRSGVEMIEGGGGGGKRQKAF